jgi:putative CocE/NonD family hydrolase
MVTGWYDLFLPEQLRDFSTLRQAGRRTRITIGPWHHGELGCLRTIFSDSVSWLAAHLLDDTAQLNQSPVRLYLQGARRWLDFPDWPPPSAPKKLHLHRSGGLGWAPPENAPPDTFTYDPSRPTPSIGGPLLGGKPKQRDNHAVESRPDVLVFTGEPLTRDLDVIGEVSATVHVRTGTPHADVFVRLCDVDRRGVSRNVCDGIIRLHPDALDPDEDGITAVELALYPTAYRFRQGHRLRVQVAGGGFPRFTRNPGTGEPLADATRSRSCRFEIFHDEIHPSHVLLPLF